MMNRKSVIILGVIFLLTSVSVFGQEVTFMLGEKNKYKNIKLLKENNDGSIIASYKTDEYSCVLVVYSKDKYLFEYSKEVDMRLNKSIDKKGNKLGYESTLVANETIYAFARGYNVDTKLIDLYVSLYDTSLELKEDWKYVYSIEPGIFDEFYIEISNDKSKFLVWGLSYGARKKDNTDDSTFINYKVFNADFTLFANNKIDYSYNDSAIVSEEGSKIYVKFRKTLVSNEGVVYKIIKYSNCETVLYQFGSVSQGVHKDLFRWCKISLSNNDVADVDFFIDKHGNPVLAGLYSKKGDKEGENNGILGAYYIKVNATTMTEEEQKTIPFSEEFLAKFISGKKIIKGLGISNAFLLKDVINNKEGQIILIAEKEFSSQNGTEDIRDFQNIYDGENISDHHENLVIICLNEMGELKYFSTIDKKGFSSDSYNCFSISDGLLLFYNDFYRNGKVGKSKIQKLVGANNNALVKAFIDNDGNVTKDVVITNNNSKVEFEPKNCIKTSNSKGLLMLGTKRNKLKIIRIDVK